MPILEGFNPFDWDQRVNYILEKKKEPIYELEPIEMKIGIIKLITDQAGLVYLYMGNKLMSQGGFYANGDLAFLRSRIEDVDRLLRKQYKIVKINAFLPFWLLKRLYLPSDFKPYKKSRKKRII